MTVSLDTDLDSVTLQPDVLNGGEGLELKVLLSGNAEVRPEGRVMGINEIRQIKPRMENIIWSWPAFLAVPILAIVLFTINSIFDLFDPALLNDSFMIVWAIWILVVLSILFRQQRRWRRL